MNSTNSMNGIKCGGHRPGKAGEYLIHLKNGKVTTAMYYIEEFGESPWETHDGNEIDEAQITHWAPLPEPPGAEGDDGWIEWGGGECPTKGRVEFKLRDGEEDSAMAEYLDWKHLDRSDDIIEYRVIGSNWEE